MVADPACRCGHPNESAQHVIEDCPLSVNHRTILRRSMENEGYTWPYANDSYMRDYNTWQSLKIFAKEYLTEKEGHGANQNG